MKLNFRPTSVAYLDFETQSEQDLAHGLTKYMSHPSTKALTCVVRIDGVNHKIPAGGDFSRLPALVAGRTVVAHNAPFDAAVWERVLKLPPIEWFDTLPCARAAGLPGGLDKLSLAVGGRGKDKNGERLIKMLCILKPGQKPPAIGPAHELLLDYNVQDVEELELVYNRVKDFGEPDVMAVDRLINERGIPVDRKRFERLQELFLENRAVAGEAFGEHTDGINPRSQKQVLDWFMLQGFDMTNSEGKKSINKPAMQALLANPEKFYDCEGDLGDAIAVVKEAIELRKETVGVGSSKVEAALNIMDTDDRIRDQLVYYGAHTGRWSGRRLQPHNLSVGLGISADIKQIDLTLVACQEVANASSTPNKRIPTGDVLSALVRTCVRSDNFLVADWAGIEVRGLFWVARDIPTLAKLGDPRESLYIDMAEKVFGRRISKKENDPYQLAKSVVLGCGYGMSGKKFAYTMMLRSVPLGPLAEVGLKPEDCSKLYREGYPLIPLLWKRYAIAVMDATSGAPAETGRCKFYMSGQDLYVQLPSGRCLIYRNARVELVVPSYCAIYSMPEVPIPTVTYETPRGYRASLYGGKITENIVQAICRDFLASALLNCEQAGFPVDIHIHDEIVTEASESRLNEFVSLISDPPAWASDFPMLVEGYSGPVWTKHTQGYREAKAMRGIVL